MRPRGKCCDRSRAGQSIVAFEPTLPATNSIQLTTSLAARTYTPSAHARDASNACNAKPICSRRCHSFIRVDDRRSAASMRGAPDPTGCQGIDYQSYAPFNSWTSGVTKVGGISSSHQDQLPARTTVSRHRERRHSTSASARPTASSSAADASASSASGGVFNLMREEPSILGDAAGCSTPARRPRAAFCLTGQPRTFVHPQSHQSILRAMRLFGADAYTFFVLTDDDGGGSYGHTPLRSQSELIVQAAMQKLRPKEASYGSLERPGGVDPIDERRKGCRLPLEGPRYGGKTFSTTFW